LKITTNFVFCIGTGRGAVRPATPQPASMSQGLFGGNQAQMGADLPDEGLQGDQANQTNITARHAGECTHQRNAREGFAKCTPLQA